MSHEQFKTYLQRDKNFLKELYSSDSKAKTKNILTFASDGELNTLTKYIHLVCNGEIHLKKENFSFLQKNLRFIRKTFEKKTALQTLNQQPRKEKLKALFRIQTTFQHLLFPLFNE